MRIGKKVTERSFSLGMNLIPENIVLSSCCAVDEPITNQKTMQGLNCNQLRSKGKLLDNLVYDQKTNNLISLTSS